MTKSLFKITDTLLQLLHMGSIKASYKHDILSESMNYDLFVQILKWNRDAQIIRHQSGECFFILSNHIDPPNSNNHGTWNRVYNLRI